MPIASDELQVITRTYDLTLWTSRHIAGFAKLHRFTLGQRLDDHLTDVLEGLIRARYDAAERRVLLRQVNTSLELLRFQFRLAKDLRCLNLDSYGYAVNEVNEIGRMVGGWLRVKNP